MRKQATKNAKQPQQKRRKVTCRRTGAATKGLYARGPMA